MKFNEEILKQFNLEPEEEKIPFNVMKISEMLDFMKICAERLVKKSKVYIESSDAEIQMDCIDVATVKLNDFAQVFRDLLIYMRKEENTYNGGTSLRYSVVSFDSFNFEETEVEKVFLREMLLRNEITHDYFNREIHMQKLIWIMLNCCEGAIDVYNDLYVYCADRHILDRYADKNF